MTFLKEGRKDTVNSENEIITLIKQHKSKITS